MIERPERQLAEFARAGADVITIHAEATPHLDYALSHIRDAGLAAGLAVCPSTPLEVYREVAAKVDLALCMTVNPGWGGQRSSSARSTGSSASRRCCATGAAIEVDGGIELDTGARCRERGRDALRRRHRGLRRAGPRRRLRRARRRRRRPAPVERRQREREQPGGAGVADLGAQDLVGDRRRRASRRRRRAAAASHSAAAARRLAARERGLVERARRRGAGPCRPRSARARSAGSAWLLWKTWWSTNGPIASSPSATATRERGDREHRDADRARERRAALRSPRGRRGGAAARSGSPGRAAAARA